MVLTLWKYTESKQGYHKGGKIYQNTELNEHVEQKQNQFNSATK